MTQRIVRAMCGGAEPSRMGLLDRVVAAASALASLPTVPTRDWCDAAATAAQRATTDLETVVALMDLGPTGVVNDLVAVGVAASHGEARRDGESSAALTRSRFESIRGQAYRPGAFTPATGVTAETGPSSASPYSAVWGGAGGDARAETGVACASAPLDGTTTRVVAVYVVGVGLGPEDQTATGLGALMPLLVRQASVAIGSRSIGPQDWITPREQEVLVELLMGKSVPTIAREQHRSAHTVHDHVKALHRKLGATTRGELVSRTLGFVRPTKGAHAERAEPTVEPKPGRAVPLAQPPGGPGTPARATDGPGA